MIAPLVEARHDFTDIVSGGGAVDARLEVPTAAGVPDVMFVEWDEAGIADRERRGLRPVVDLTRTRVLLVLSEAPVEVGALTALVGVSARHLRRTVLPALAEIGWIRIDSQSTVSLADGVEYLSPVRSMVTVEAKLSDWRRAFKQAALHAESADQAFIALDASRAAAGLRVANELAREGVGVATVDAATGIVNVVSRPVTRSPRGARFMFAAEQVWELRRQQRHSGDVRHVFGRDPLTLRTAV